MFTTGRRSNKSAKVKLYNISCFTRTSDPTVLINDNWSYLHNCWSLVTTEDTKYKSQQMKEINYHLLAHFKTQQQIPK